MCLYSLYAYKKGYNRVDADIKQDTLEDCINSENILSKAIGNVHRDILYCSALQGEILAVLKEITTPEAYKLILRNSIVMSRTHANFLLTFYGLVEEFPRLMTCVLTQIFILQKPENYQVCS